MSTRNTWQFLLVALSLFGMLAACGPGGSDGSGGAWTVGSGSGSGDDGELDQVEIENGRYIVSQSAPPGFTAAAFGEEVDCEIFEGSNIEDPTLVVAVGSYSAGEYEIDPRGGLEGSTSEPRAQVAIAGLGDGSEDAERELLYSAISGTVELKSDLREGGASAEFDVDATFPDPLVAEGTCSYGEPGPGLDAGSGGGPTCQCIRNSGSDYECQSTDGEAGCCFEEQYVDSTFDFRRTLEAKRCTGYGELADAGSGGGGGSGGTSD